MPFFNKKEDVIDIQLTKYGKSLVALGKFKPVYYAFFDEDILYDVAHMDMGESGTATEAQNDTETRINTSVRLRPVAGFVEAASGPINEDSIAASTQNIDKPLRNELRKASLGVQQAPAWQVRVYSDGIETIEEADSSDVNIPQINCDIKYIKDPLTDSFVVKEELLFEVEEKNVDYKMSNFEVEVFEVTTEDGTEVLRDLHFSDSIRDLFDSDKISYFMDLEIDSEIDPNVLKDVIDKSKSMFVTRIQTTGDEQVNMADIYNRLNQNKVCE